MGLIKLAVDIAEFGGLLLVGAYLGAKYPSATAKVEAFIDKLF